MKDLELVRPGQGRGELLPAGGRDDLVRDFLMGRTEETRKGYRKDLEAFRRFLVSEGMEVPNVAGAARELLLRGPGEAARLVLRWRNQEIEEGRSPATVNRRLSTLRSLVRMARLVGLVSWSLDVQGVKLQPYRDTRGPGLEGVRAILQGIQGDDPKARRDRALVWLLFGMGLRRVEVVRLQVEDLDLEGGLLWVQGKGRRQKEGFSIPGPVKEALEAWMETRGTEPGPLFLRLSQAGKPLGALTGSGLYWVISSLGRNAGVRARPHGLRHAAITAALDKTRGDVRAVQRFSRHADVRTVQLYDDARTDLFGQVAQAVTEGIQCRSSASR